MADKWNVKDDNLKTIQEIKERLKSIRRAKNKINDRCPRVSYPATEHKFRLKFRKLRLREWILTEWIEYLDKNNEWNLETKEREVTRFNKHNPPLRNPFKYY